MRYAPGHDAVYGDPLTAFDAGQRDHSPWLSYHAWLEIIPSPSGGSRYPAGR